MAKNPNTASRMPDKLRVGKMVGLRVLKDLLKKLDGNPLSQKTPSDIRAIVFERLARHESRRAQREIERLAAASTSRTRLNMVIVMYFGLGAERLYLVYQQSLPLVADELH